MGHSATHARCWLAAFVAAFILAGCASIAGSPQRAADLPAFLQVDEGLYRGGQPTPDGFQQLAGMGVKTVICLRRPSPSMERERRLVEQLGMRWVSIPMWYFWRPSNAQVRQFLALATDPASRPVFVHCRQGRNRAGIMVALYRVTHQGWLPEEAYAEGRRLGLVWWNPMTRHLLLREASRQFRTAASPPQTHPNTPVGSGFGVLGSGQHQQ